VGCRTVGSSPRLRQAHPGARVDIGHARWGWVDLIHDMLPRITHPDLRRKVWVGLGCGGNRVSISTWVGRRLAERIVGRDAGQQAVQLPIHARLSEAPKLFGSVRSPALALFRRIGQRALYRWYARQVEAA